MKPEVFNIVFDQDYFYAGNHLTGMVVLELKYPMEMQGVYLDVEGFAHCMWNKTGGDHYQTFKGEEVYLARRVLFFGTDKEGGPLIYHPAGHYEYRFDLLIPATAPASFECDTGQVRYSCLAKVNRGWKGEFVSRLNAKVLRTLDLTQIPNVAIPVSCQEEEAVEGCCYGAGVVYIMLSLPKKGYIPGEDLHFDFEVDNQSPEHIHGFCLSLTQCVTCFGYEQPHGTEKKTNREEYIFPLFDSGLTVAKKKKATFHLSTKIPPVVPSKLEGCSVMEINYELALDVDVGWSHKILEMELFIGTIPIDMDQLQAVALPPAPLTTVVPAPISMPLPSTCVDAAPSCSAPMFVHGATPPMYSAIDGPPPAYSEIVHNQKCGN